ncbi:cucumber peeling cupredoxin-like protein [Tanacetum coccineum]
MLACIHLHGSMAQRIHIVGGSLGWTIPPNGPPTYATWASRETFTVGNTLLFNFTTGAHTVVEVAQAAYGPCNVANPISVSAIGAACKSLACIRLYPRGQSCLYAPSTCCGSYVCDIRTSYISRQCTSSDGDNIAPCLLRRLATPDWLLLTF